jgi:hypothetical protein
MEAVILFLLKAVASGTAGHYTKRALEKVDLNLGAMFARGASVDEIEKEIEQKQVTKAIENIFEESIKNSIILPDLSVAATPDDIVQVIQAIVQFGFDTARSEKFDLVLPGSPLGSNSLSIFKCSILEQKVYVQDRSVKWDYFRTQLYIVPTAAAELKKYWSSYLKEIRNLRADAKTEDLEIGRDFSAPKKFNKQFEVEYLTAGSVFYKTPSGQKPKAPTAYSNWNRGLIAMITGAKAIKELEYLPISEWKKLKDVIEKLKDL